MIYQDVWIHTHEADEFRVRVEPSGEASITVGQGNEKAHLFLTVECVGKVLEALTKVPLVEAA